MASLNIGPWADDLLNGLWVTVYITLLSAALAVVVAFTLGMVVRLRHIVPRTIARVVIEFLRGTSLLVQLFWLFYALPLIGYRLDPIQVGVLAFALNLSPFHRMRRVILPQALPLMIPPFGNLLIQLIKSTPLVFLITLTDLTAVADQYRASEGNEAFIFGLLLVVYFVLAYIST